MKRLVLLFSVLPFFLNAQGVIWEKSLKSAFEKARNENKVLFVEFYSPGCSYCKQVAPFFKEKQVADLYNASFINYQADVDTDEARAFLNSANIDLYGIPQFFFFRGDTTLVHAREVSANLASVLQPANMVLEGKFTGEKYAERFAAGVRTFNFLYYYALFSKVQKDLETNKKIVNALWDSYPVEKRNSSESWAVTKKATMDTENGFVDYWLQNLDQVKAYEEKSGHGDIENAFAGIFYTTLFNTELDSKKITELRKKFAPVLGEETLFSLVWEKEVKANLKEGNVKLALATGNEFATANKGIVGSLIYLSQVFNDTCNEKPCNDAVTKWLETARPLLKEKNEKATFYLQLARLNFKESNKEMAKKHANQALVFAKEANLNLQEYNKFLKEISI